MITTDENANAGNVFEFATVNNASKNFTRDQYVLLWYYITSGLL